MPVQNLVVLGQFFSSSLVPWTEAAVSGTVSGFHSATLKSLTRGTGFHAGFESPELPNHTAHIRNLSPPYANSASQ